MTTLKRILTMLLAAALLFALCACGKDKKADESTDAPDVSQGTESSGTDESTGSSSSELDRNLDEKGYFKGVKATDYLVLPQYIGLEVPRSVVTPNSEEVSRQINAILENYAVEEKITEGVVQDGDTINIDYTGTVDGVAFDGGSTNGAGSNVTIGVDSFIDNMLERMVGHSVGENFDLDAHFPEDYRNTDLAGKDSVFNVTINYIVKPGDVPTTLTNEMAADFGFATADALMQDIESWVIRQQESEMFYSLFSDIELNELPEAVMDFVISDDMAYFYDYASQTGMEVDDIISQYTEWETSDEYIAGNYANFSNTAATYVLIQAIAEQEGITATDEDIAAFGFDSYRGTYSDEYLKMFILQERLVPQFIFDNAKIVD